MTTNREDIGAMALHYGYIGVDRDNIVDIVESYASTLAEDLRKTKAERDRLASWVLLRCPNCNYIMAPAEHGSRPT